MLVEQLDMATSALHEERQEEDQLHLSIAAVKLEMATSKLAANEAQTCLAGKAFSMI